MYNFTKQQLGRRFTQTHVSLGKKKLLPQRFVNRQPHEIVNHAEDKPERKMKNVTPEMSCQSKDMHNKQHKLDPLINYLKR